MAHARVWVVLPLVVAACGNQGSAPSAGTFDAVPVDLVSRAFPDDIDGGAPNATYDSALRYAWREFIALNWPALDGGRGQSDPDQLFGDPGFVGPLTWHTMRSAVEVYPGSGDSPHGFVNDAGVQFGYAALPPRYVYGAGEATPCIGQAPPSAPAWVNLDEATEILNNRLYAGTSSPTDPSGANSSPQLVRYSVKLNAVDYAYVADPANSYWNHGAAYEQATKNFLAVSHSIGTQLQLSGPTISFPNGSLELKSAWRPLSASEQSSGRFYQTTVRYYEEQSGDGGADGQYCYREATWGLIGMHIMHKTPTAPAWTFSTFEQTDTLVDADGTSVEDDDGAIIHPPAALTPWSPDLAFTDGASPLVSIVGTSYCDAPGARLAFRERKTGFKGSLLTGIPSGGLVCVNSRYDAIGEPVISINRSIHTAMRAYANAHSLGDSPWLHYKLVGIQWRPFDLADIASNDAGSTNSSAIYYTANLTMESDYTTQHFAGTLKDNGTPTTIGDNFPNFNHKKGTFANVLVFDAQRALQSTYTMGGCLGCHNAISVNSGADSSYTLHSGRVGKPELTRYDETF